MSTEEIVETNIEELTRLTQFVYWAWKQYKEPNLVTLEWLWGWQILQLYYITTSFHMIHKTHNGTIETVSFYQMVTGRCCFIPCFI